MRALVITKHGPPEVLRVEERPDPTPGPGEVRVAVRAAGINFADTSARMGIYPDAPKPPCVVGYEFAGEVESLGEGAEGVAVGDRVMGGCRFGAYAELVVTGAGNLIPLPKGWSFEEGAAVPVVYGTAYACLIRYGSLHAGERVLIQAAAGGLGTAATQIAKLVDAGEIYGTASASKHDAIRGFGVDHPIDYRTTDFASEVRRISGEDQPLDLVVDSVGGKSLKRSWSLLRPGGRLVGAGFSAASTGQRRNVLSAARAVAQMPRFWSVPMMSESKSFIGLNMLRLWDAKGSLDEFIDPLRDWLEAGKLRPVVSEAFPLERGADAHRFIQDRKNVGKVVLTL